MDPGKIIFDTVRGAGFPVPLSNLIVAQARHESADFTSNVYKTCLNPFGYKFIGQDLATGSCIAAPEGGYYAKYSRIQDAAREIVAWIRRRQVERVFPADLSTITSPAQYAQLLKSGSYYGDPVSVYTNGLLRFAVNYGDSVALGGLLVAGLVLWYLNRKK